MSSGIKKVAINLISYSLLLFFTASIHAQSLMLGDNIRVHNDTYQHHEPVDNSLHLQLGFDLPQQWSPPIQTASTHDFVIPDRIYSHDAIDHHAPTSRELSPAFMSHGSVKAIPISLPNFIQQPSVKNPMENINQQCTHLENLMRDGVKNASDPKTITTYVTLRNCIIFRIRYWHAK